jgi:hypothetical protein
MLFLPAFFAHAFGQNYTLPLPLWLFLFSAAAVVLLSFAIFAFLLDEPSENSKKPNIKWRHLGILIPIGKVIGVFLLLISIAADLGNNNIFGISVTFFWIILLLGFTYLTAVSGNLWDFVNPFKTLFEIIEKIAGKQHKPLIRYPASWSYWPALLIYYGIIWLELISNGFGTKPANLSLMLLNYTVVTLLLMFWFGKEVWLKHGEFFSVFFGLVSKISPVKIQESKFALRRPLSGLSDGSAPHISALIFIIFMLASTGFDGFKETTAFWRITTWLPGLITDSYILYQSLFLLLAPLFLLAIYLLAMWCVKHLANTEYSVSELAKKFAYSLIPIAVAYNAAHYFSLFWLDAANIVGYLFDPLNLGWSSFQVYVSPVSASTVWYSSVALIIAGHVAAVYVAHKRALQIFKNRRAALESQYVLIVLMVFYTMGSLWIIGQPLTIK